jgi:uncharacterized coiled-coil DUF342 family protein
MRSGIVEGFQQMHDAKKFTELSNRVEALEDEVRFLKILAKALAEKIQTHSEVLVEYER